MIDVVVAAGGAAWESAGVREIEADADLRLVRRCVDVADLLAFAPAAAVDVAVVATALPGLDADTVFRLERERVQVIGVGDDDRCRALGISARGQVGALARSITVLDPPTDPPAAAEAGSRAPVVAVWGPSGAPGRSTVAASLASASAHAGTDTVLLDADTSGGSLAQQLAMLDDVSGLVAACRAANQGRAEEVDRHLLEVEPALRLLSGIARADMATQVRPAALELVLGRLRGTCELVIADLGSALDATARELLDDADLVVVVGRADPVGLTRLVRCLHDLASLQTTTEPIVVVNLMRPSLGWTEREVTDTLTRLTGTSPAVFVPADVATVDLAVMRGVAPRDVAASGPVASAIGRLSDAVCARLPAVTVAD